MHKGFWRIDAIQDMTEEKLTPLFRLLDHCLTLGSLLPSVHTDKIDGVNRQADTLVNLVGSL